VSDRLLARPGRGARAVVAALLDQRLTARSRPEGCRRAPQKLSAVRPGQVELDVLWFDHRSSWVIFPGRVLGWLACRVRVT
jgi:hypothetical protein